MRKNRENHFQKTYIVCSYIHSCFYVFPFLFATFSRLLPRFFLEIHGALAFVPGGSRLDLGTLGDAEPGLVYVSCIPTIVHISMYISIFCILYTHIYMLYIYMLYIYNYIYMLYVYNYIYICYIYTFITTNK